MELALSHSSSVFDLNSGRRRIRQMKFDTNAGSVTGPDAFRAPVDLAEPTRYHSVPIINFAGIS